MYLCYACGRGEEEAESVVRSLGFRMKCFGIGVANEWGSAAQDMLRDEMKLWPSVLDEEDCAAVIVTHNMLTDVMALVELDAIGKRCRKGKIEVYTVLYHIEAGELPRRMKWLCDTHILCIQTITDIREVSAAIAKDYWKGRLCVQAGGEDGKSAVTAVVNTVKHLRDVPDDFVKVLEEDYGKIEPENFVARLLLLIVMGQYLFASSEQIFLFQMHRECVNTLLEQICSGFPCTALEVEILQYCIRDLCCCMQQMFRA